MKKIFTFMIIFIVHISLQGCGKDVIDFVHSRDNLLKKALIILSLSSNGFPPNLIIKCSAETNGTSICQYGITWTFDKEYQYGQFANGDYWVIGPITIVGISPASRSVSGVIRNGSEVNPIPNGGYQGYDNRMAYQSNLNVAYNVSPSNPLVLDYGSSLISTISYQVAHRPQLTDAAVLTVLESAPPEGSFRPPYCGSDKTIKFNKSQINYALLPSLSLSGITANPNTKVTNLCATLKRVWVDHYQHLGNGTQYSSPINNMPNYGREYSTMFGEASLLLMIDPTALQSRYGVTREDIAVGLIQIGIDNYEVLKNGGWWLCGGGLNHGRKWTILFAGIMLNDNDMKNVGSFPFTPVTVPGNTYQLTQPFHEDSQLRYVDQTLVNDTHVPYWGVESHDPYVGPDTRDKQKIPYTSSDIGMPEWGLGGNITLTRWNKYWGAIYRDCCTGNSWAGIALSALICSAKTLYKNNVFFDYVDRYMATASKGDWTRSYSQFTEQMWDRYRSSYGTCYTGLSSNTRQYGSCSAAGVVK